MVTITSGVRLRTNGIDEKYITGDADDFAKFQKWAETVPYTMRNPPISLDAYGASKTIRNP